MLNPWAMASDAIAGGNNQDSSRQAC